MAVHQDLADRGEMSPKVKARIEVSIVIGSGALAWAERADDLHERRSIFVADFPIGSAKARAIRKISDAGDEHEAGRRNHPPR